MKRFSIKKIFKEIAIAIVMITVVSLILNYFRQPDISNSLPPLNMMTIDGESIDLKPRAQPTVIHFWATWCPTCKFEAPNIESLQTKANIITVAVNSGSDSELQQFMREREYTYSVVNDTQGALAAKFDVQAFPTTFIYDRDGQLKFAEVGYTTTVGLSARLALID